MVLTENCMQEFKKIVEDLLGELMAELGVSDTQFVEACQKAEQNPIHKKIVDQIMAVDNFLAFKKLMVKRNQELNRQAIEMFEKFSKQGKETPAQGADSAQAAATDAAKPAEEEKKAEEPAPVT